MGKVAGDVIYIAVINAVGDGVILAFGQRSGCFFTYGVDIFFPSVTKERVMCRKRKNGNGTSRLPTPARNVVALMPFFRYVNKSLMSRVIILTRC